MGFYLDKISTYSQNEDAMSLDAKMKIVMERRAEQLFSEYQNLKDNYQQILLSQTPVHGVEAYSAVNNFYGYETNKLRQELKDVSTLAPQDYFTKISMQEILKLNAYNQGKVEEYCEIAKQLTTPKGVMSSIKEALGLKKDSETLFKEQDKIAVKYNVGMEALEEWKHLSFTEKLSYVVDRALYEDEYSFSSEKLDKFSQSQQPQEAQDNQQPQDNQMAQDSVFEIEEVNLSEIIKKDEMAKEINNNITVEDVSIQ